MRPVGRPVAGILLDADLALGNDRGPDRAARVKVATSRRMVRIRRVTELEIAERR
jgi:hypothetical protein